MYSYRPPAAVAIALRMSLLVMGPVAERPDRHLVAPLADDLGERQRRAQPDARDAVGQDEHQLALVVAPRRHHVRAEAQARLEVRARAGLEAMQDTLHDALRVGVRRADRQQLVGAVGERRDADLIDGGQQVDEALDRLDQVVEGRALHRRGHVEDEDDGQR
jgi:hypothetical protein